MSILVVVVLPPTRVVIVGSPFCVGVGIVMVVASCRYCRRVTFSGGDMLRDAYPVVL